MTPDERKARNRQWRDLWAIAERWEAGDYGLGAAMAARELKEMLRAWGAPRPPGRPKERR